MTELYHLVNVPSAVWIDEHGQIRRINEGTYTGLTPIGSSTPDDLPLVKDWARHGDKSPYVWNPREVTLHIRKSNADEALARTYWKRAQALAPENWNYHRQDWLGTEGLVGAEYRAKRAGRGNKPYYAPLEIPPAGDSAGPRD